MGKILLTFVCLCFSNNYSQDSSNNQAVEKDTLSNYYLFEYIESLNAEDYVLYLDSIKNEQSYDFFSFRMSYSRTKEYSPYSTDISDMHKRIRSSIENNNYHFALQIADSILLINYPDIRAHLYCGYIYKQLGDSVKSKYHYNIYNGLLESIFYSGDGKSPETAYITITTKEEYAFIEWLGLKFKAQELVIEDNYAFDLIETSDVESNDTYNIYFNITLAYNILDGLFK